MIIYIGVHGRALQSGQKRAMFARFECGWEQHHAALAREQEEWEAMALETCGYEVVRNFAQENVDAFWAEIKHGQTVCRSPRPRV